MAYKGKKLADMTPAQRQARVQQLAKTGNTAAVPTKYLTGDLAHYAKQRLLNARLNAPVVPGSTLSNRDLAHEAQSAVETQYGPQQTALNQQLASNANQPRQTSSYFQDYINALGGAIKQNQQAGGALYQQLGQIQPTDNSAQNLQAAQADAAARGASVSPDIAVQAQQGRAVNQGIMGAYQGQAGVQAQAQQQYLQGLVAAAEAGKTQALNQVASQGAGLQAQNQQLAREKGAADLSYRTKRRSEELTNVATSQLAGVNAQATAAKVGIAQQNADTSAKRASSSAKTARTAQQTKDATFAATHEGYSPTAFARLPVAKQLQVLKDVKTATTTPKSPAKVKPKKPVVGPGSLTATAENAIVGRVTTAAGYLMNPPKNDSGQTLTEQQILDGLRTGKNPLKKALDPREVQLARDLAANGGGAVGPNGVHNAHLLGIHVNKRWKVKPKPTAGNSVGAIVQGVQGAAS